MTALLTQEADGPPMGHNNPPESTPYENFKAYIDDLAFEAKNFLDGKPIETEEQAAAVSKILNDARKARTDADAQRKVEAKPFDDGKAAVQALWTPLTDEKKGRCAQIAETCKQVLAPWLKKIEDKQAAEAEAAKAEAARLAQIALDAHKASAGNLEALEDAERLLSAAKAAAVDAAKAGKARAQVRGGGRATSLRSEWTPTLTDSVEALKHYRATKPDALKEWLTEQACKDVHAGARAIPGFTITEERKAV
jgi:hypothetical protein